MKKQEEIIVNVKKTKLIKYFCVSLFFSFVLILLLLPNIKILYYNMFYYNTFSIGSFSYTFIIMLLLTVIVIPLLFRYFKMIFIDNSGLVINSRGIKFRTTNPFERGIELIDWNDIKTITDKVAYIYRSKAFL